MARGYGSFVLRIWRLSGGEGRVEVEHIQSGERVRLTSLEGAFAWIEARCPTTSDGGRAPAVKEQHSS